VLDFQNVVPLEEQAIEHQIRVDTPDTAPTEDEPGAAAPRKPAAPPAVPPPAKTASGNTAPEMQR